MFTPETVKVLDWIVGGMLPPHPRAELYKMLGKPMRRILVTGAAGRLGQALQRHNDGIEYIPISGVDLSYYENAVNVISGCGKLDGIVNLAGGYSSDEDEMFSKNFLTALNSVAAAIQYGALGQSQFPRIVLIGAASALSNPQTPYELSKKAVHDFAKALARDLPPKFKVNVVAPTEIKDYDYVAQQIVKLLLPNQTQTGEIFIT